MDFTGLIIIAFIIIWTIFEYQKREHLHRAAMEYIKRGEHPPEVIKRPQLLQVVATGGVGVLLLGLMGLLVKMGVQYGWAIELKLLPASLPITLLFVFVLLIFVRDVRNYRKYTTVEAR